MMDTQTELPGDLSHPVIADERFRDREASFATIPEDAPRLGICSDDRGLAPESWRNLVTFYGVSPELPYNRDFGGPHGDSFDYAVAVAAQYGPDALRAFANNPESLALEVKKMVRADNEFAEQEGFGPIFVVDHSDDHSEHSPTDLMDGDGDVGCLFNKKFGYAMWLAANHPEIQAEARESYVAQGLNPAKFDAVVQGAKGAFTVLLGENADYSVRRKETAFLADRDAKGKPVAAIVAGAHFGVPELVEIGNYVANSGAKPDPQHPALVTDMTDKTLRLCRASQRQGLTLDPEYLFAVKELKRALVRFALSDGKARTMAHTSRGNAQEALAYIKQKLALAA